ncbi:hypothetical protein ACM66B_003376 [Microbotryomycetes sp. NB124-2]
MSSRSTLAADATSAEASTSATVDAVADSSAAANAQQTTTNAGPSRRDGRRRAVVACLRCKQRRTRCDGEPQCSECTKAGQECEYKGTQRRVWVTQHTFLELERTKAQLEKRCEELEQQVKHAQANQQHNVTSPTGSTPNNNNNNHIVTSPAGMSPRSAEGGGGSSKPVNHDLRRVLMSDERAGHLVPVAQQHTVTPVASTHSSPTLSNGHPSPRQQPPPRSQTPTGVVEGVPSAPTLMTDPQGKARYMGTVSGAYFHDALWLGIWRTLPANVSSVAPALPMHSYHTSDSKPILLATSDPLFLPPYHEAKRLVSMFFATCTDPLFWVPRSFETMIDQYYRNGVTADDRWNLCVFYCILALGAQHSADSARTGDSLPGMEHFAKAKLLLFNFCEESSVTCVQALALVAYFLLSAHRRDAAYAYIGLATRTCVALGLHRNLPHPTAGDNQILLEERKRLFWSVYCLDRIICCALGRSTQLSDSEIQIGRVIDAPGFPPAITLNRLIDLCRISGEITSNLYISTDTTDTYSAAAALDLLAQLDQWQADEPGPAAYNFQMPRTYHMLELNHLLLINLATRPIFLHVIGGAAVLFPASASTPLEQLECSRLLQTRCIRAARLAANSLGHLLSTSTMSPWSFFELHHAYNAGVIIILARMLNILSDVEYQSAANELGTCQTILGAMQSAGNESAASCQAILSTLHLVAEQFRKFSFMPFANPPNHQQQLPTSNSATSTSGDGGGNNNSDMFSNNTVHEPMSPRTAQQLLEAFESTIQSLEREQSWAASLAPASILDPSSQPRQSSSLLYPGAGTREAFPHLHQQHHPSSSIRSAGSSATGGQGRHSHLGAPTGAHMSGVSGVPHFVGLSSPSTLPSISTGDGTYATGTNSYLPQPPGFAESYITYF